MCKPSLASLSGIVLAFCAALPVHSQQTDGTETAAAPEGLAEIVVTALKRKESAQSIPVTVEAVTGATLQQQGVKDLFQAVTLVPGVVFSRAPDDGLALTFRGLGTQARPQAFEQSVALFTDGIFIGKGRLYTTSFFDVDRIEFIKGTQSTLLGKNASLGAISVVTRQPGDTLSFDAQGGYEFVNGGYTFDGASDIPLAKDVSLRLAAHYNDLDGWVHNDLTNHDGPEHKDLGVRATLAAQINEILKLTVSYQYADNQQIGSNYQLIGPIPPSYGDGLLNDHTSQYTSLNNDGDTYHQTKSDIGSVKLQLQLGDHQLISQTSYLDYDLKFNDDFDFSSDDSVNFQRFEAYRQLTEELRLQSPTDRRVEYMAGVFYLDSHWNSLENQLWAVPGFPPAGGPPPGQLFNGPFHNQFVQDSRAYSGFASFNWHVTDALRLTGGLRYTHEEKDVVYGRTDSAPFTVWNTIANPPFDPTQLSHSSNFVDGNVSLQYDIAHDIMAYVAFGHGSKSGGYVETNTIAIPPPLLVNGKVPADLVAAGSAIKDEFTKTYEVGLKTTLLERRLRLNTALFWTDIEDFQDTVFTGGTLGFLTFNGPARSRGAEFESAFQIVPSFRVDGGVTYADSTSVIQPIDPATNAPEVDASGNPVLRRYRRSQAPKLIYNVGGTYETALTGTLDLRLGASVRYRSSMFNQRQEEFPSRSLTTLDLSAGIQGSSNHWGIDLIAKNVTNAIAEDFASPSVDPRFGAFYSAYLAGPNQLRTVMLMGRVNY
jgi:iron complex outermembrane receptor protein